MSEYPTITLTGADERTAVQDLEDLAAASPASVEIGLLYSATPEGRPRYPSLRWLEMAASHIPKHCAVHICGRLARQQLVNGELKPLLRHARCVQVNGSVTPADIVSIGPHVDVLITQWQPGRDTPELVRAIADVTDAMGIEHQWLVDGSGGLGRLPEAWECPQGSSQVGFAGGLGPETLLEALPAIAEVASGRWWVDMENSLRVEDRFDVQRCWAALNCFMRWKEKVEPEKLFAP